MTEAFFKKVMAEVYPSSLDEIVRDHRDELKLDVATTTDLQEIDMSFPITNLKGVLEIGYIYKWTHPQLGFKHLFLVGKRVGANETQGLHSSRLIGFDTANQVALTQSGSHYLLQKYIDPKEAPLLLLHICAWLHQTPAGAYFGVPDWRMDRLH